MKKYKLTNEVNERGLHRIVALRDIPGHGVEAGDLGGFVESEKNLSQDGDAWVGGDAQVYGRALVFENALVCDDAYISGDACIFGDAWVRDNAQVFGNAQVYDNARVTENVQVFGNARVYGNAWLFRDARVSSGKDYIVFKNWWSSERYFTWTRSNNMWKVGCFYGTGKELVAKAEKDSELSGKEYKRAVDYVESILKEESQDKKKTIHRDSKGRFCKSK